MNNQTIAKLFASIFVFAIIASSSNVVFATSVRYVAPTGSDSENSCLVSSEPCRTVGWAVGQAQSGDMIKIAAGTYTNPDMAVEKRLLNLNKSLALAGGYSAADWETADPLANPTILDGQGLGQILYADTAGITVSVSGLRLTRGKDQSVYFQDARLLMSDSVVINIVSGTAVYLVNSDASQITHSRIADNTWYGLYTTSSDNLLVEGNAFTNNDYGIVLGGSNTLGMFRGNTITGNRFYGVLFSGSNNTGAVLEGNTISGTYQGYGVYFSSSSNNVIFRANTIAGNSNHGLRIFGNNQQLDNNIIARNAGDGIEWSSGSGTLRHNTIADNAGGAGIRAGSPTLTLVNNVISGHTYGILTTSTFANVNADHTLWHGNSQDTGAAGGVNITTSNDVYGDPAFAGGMDPFAAYHLTAGSAAIDAGAETDLLTDIDGEGRALPDIGADEYPYVLGLTPDYRRTAEPGTVVEYVHTLRNSGSLSDTVSLSAVSSQGWTLSLEPTSVTLASGETASVTLSVTVPADAAGQVDSSLITAVSTSDPSVFATVQDVTLVGMGVSLGPDHEQAAAPGESLTYTHTLTNLGSSPDTFTLSLDSSRGWATLLTGSPVALEPGASAEVQVQVEVPLAAAIGVADVTTITAQSTSVPEVLAVAVDETAAIAVSGARHVAPSGVDSENSCLVASEPCRTLGWAVGQAQSGDVIKIAAGTYVNPDMAVEKRLLNLNKSLTLAGGYSAADWETADPLANPTILDGQGLGQILYADTAGITVSVSGLRLTRGKDQSVYFQDARLLMSDSVVINIVSGTAVYLVNSDASQITHSRIADNTWYGLYTTSSDNLLVEGNAFTNNDYGIVLGGSNTLGMFRGNTITGNRFYGVLFSGSNNTGAVLEGNTISGTYQGYGVYFSSSSNNVIFRANTIAGNSNHGLRIFGNNQQLDNNIIARNAGDGIEWSSGSGTLRHNTIADNAGGAGIRAGSPTLTLVNNVISGHTYGILTTSTFANVNADHTLWHGNSQDTGAAGGVNITTSNDVYGDPAFAGGMDPFAAYHLTAGSAAIDAGAETDLLTDIDGEGRALPDIGADEYPYVLGLTPDYRRTAEPGTVVEYVHTLRNSGSLSDTVSLSAVSSQGWTLSLEPTSVTLASGETASVTLSVTVPADAAGLVDTSIITATSTTDAASEATATDITIVGLGVSIEPDHSQSAQQGTEVVYTHTLTNLSPVSDSFNLSLDSSQGWATLITDDTINLDTGASTEVQVRISIPLTASEGLMDRTVITAVSVTAPEVFDIATDTTTVSPISGARHVAPSGVDSENSCLVASEPCRTVGWAVGQAQSGDVIKIAAGTYVNPDMAVEKRLLNLNKSLTLAGGYSAADWGTADPLANPTILDGQGLGQILYADTAGITVSVSGLRLTRGKDQSVYFQDARLLMSDSVVINIVSGTAVYLVNSDASQITHSRIADNTWYGLYTTSSDNLLVEGNAFTNNDYGIVLGGSNTLGMFRGNTITGNRFYGVLFSGSNNTGAVLEGNTISGTYQGYGVYFSSSSNNVIFRANTIAGNSNHGLRIFGNNQQLDNNIIARNAGDGIEWSSGSGTLRHNTIADNAGGAGIRAGSPTLTLVNNVISGHTYGILTTSTFANVNADHTLWHGNSQDTGAAGGVNITTSNDVYGDPAFAGGMDPFAAYHLTAGSAAIDAGAETDLLTDIDGEGRALPDIGADEYPYVLGLTPDYRRTAEPGTVVEYVHTLRNSGSLSDTVSLSAVSSQGWTLSLEPTSVTLASGETASVTLSVTVPADAAGQVDSSLITAVSTSDPSVFATVQDVTLVGMGVSLGPDHEQAAAPGESLTYTHTLTNLGSSPDTFTLSLDSSRGWATLLTGSPVALEPGASAEVQVQVEVPLAAAIGVADVTTITAQSTSVPEVLAVAVDETAAIAVSGARHVAPSGVDSENSCLVASEPCRTLGWAVGQAQSGDVIKIAAGTYTNPDMAVEKRLLNLNKSLTLAGGYSAADWETADPLANPTILDGQGLGQILYADTAGITVSVSGLRLTRGKDQSVYFQDARLLMSDSVVINIVSGTAVYLVNSDASQITHSRIADNTWYGLYTTSSDNLLVEGNAFTNNDYGIVLGGSNTLGMFRGNTITGNRFYGVLFSGSNNTGAVLEGNTISGTYQGYGVYFSSSSNNVIFRANTIAGNSNHGLRIFGNNQQLDNNIIARNAGDGIEWSSGSGTLRHNTIADNAGGAGIRAGSPTLTLVNNVISGHTYGILTTSTFANVSADHTLWHGNSQDINNSAGSNVTSTNDISANPLFVGGVDTFEAYHIADSSPAIDAGAIVDLEEDIDGEPRPTGLGYDIGADEFPGEPNAPTEISITGPSTGSVNTSYEFSVTVEPRLTTPPVTYTWETDRNPLVTHVGSLSDTVEFQWNTPGEHVITVTATNSAGSISATHTINLEPPPAASFPFYDGFEAGALAPHWMTVTTNQGRVRVSNSYPYLGTYGVLLDDAVGDDIYSIASLILNIDLSGQTAVVLDFWWREFLDEDHEEDGVFISDDYGDNWYKVFSFNDGPSTYRREFIDLSSAVAAYGLTFNDHFQVKFQFYDNHPIPNDGYAIDEVRVIQADPIETVEISGPAAGITHESYTFTAAVGPPNATPPVTYVWEATGQETVIHTGGLTDAVTFSWDTGGTKSVTVTATNAANSVSNTHEIELSHAPSIAVEPTFFDVTLDAGLVITQTLRIINNGLGLLNFDIAVANDIVRVDPAGGSLDGPGQQEITVTFDTRNLPAGAYSDQIDISSNDPLNPLLTVPVNLTVVLIAPDAPSNPDPLDGEIDVRVDKVLSWEPAPHAIIYDLYIWEDGLPKPDIPTITDLDQPLYDPPGNLPTGTRFIWQVVARNQAGETPGPEWSFIVETLPDLQVTSLIVPPSGISGQPIDVSWVVQNSGDGSASGTWYDRIFLSPGSTFDTETVMYIGQATNPGDLDPGESYTQTTSVYLPQGITGAYYLFIWADRLNDIRESDESNNLSSPGGPIEITAAPADLMVSKTGLALSNSGFSSEKALAGHPITYTLTIENIGQSPAEDVIVIDTLPAEVTFVSESSEYPYELSGNLITWTIGELASGESVVIEVVADIGSDVIGTITNQVEATTSSQESDTDNNVATLATMVEQPIPVLSVTPTGPTLVVLQGTVSDLVATISNNGSETMTGIAVTPPPHISWVSVDTGGLTQLAPGASAEITITASVAADQTPGYYRDFIVVSEAGGSQMVIALTVKVVLPVRSLELTVENDQGARIPDATVTLVKQDASVIVTEGVVQTYHVSKQGKTDTLGVLTLTDLEIGVYEYNVIAADHEEADGIITLVEGVGPQAETLTLQALSKLSVSPTAPVIGVVQGHTAGVTISIKNVGAAPLAGVTITPPASLPWVYLATPATIPAIAPGDHVEFTIFASPSETQEVGVYQDYVVVSADGGQARQVALTVEVTTDQVLDLNILVTDDLGAPVSEGTVILTEQALTVHLIGDTETTFNQQFTADLDANGSASFSDLRWGEYNYLVLAEGYEQESGSVFLQSTGNQANGGAAIESGATTSFITNTLSSDNDTFILSNSGFAQTLNIALTPAHFTYDWQVVPLEQGYDITLTLTYDTVAARGPALAIPPRYWFFDTCNPQPIFDNIRVINLAPIELTLTNVNFSVPGVSVTIGDFPETIGPNGSVLIPVTATQTSEEEAQGRIGVGFSYLAVDDKFVTFTFNPSSMTLPLLQSNQAFNQIYHIEPVVFDPATQYSLQITQPSSLSWISVSLDQPGPMQWSDSTDIAATLSINTPMWWEEGTYTDRAVIRVNGDDGTWREGYLNIEVLRTSDGFQVHTSFELGPIPYIEKEGSGEGHIYHKLSDCGDGSEGTGWGWTWTWFPDLSRLRGVRQNSPSPTPPSFPFYIRPPINYYDHQQVRLEISQRLMLEGEGFNASLQLNNTSASPIENIFVDILLSDLNGFDRTAGFRIIPQVPTNLGNVSVGGNTSANWLILPTNLGVISPEGDTFNVRATISYTWNGTSYTIEALPETIIVYPAPELIITYELPPPDCVSTVFDMKVTIRNQGLGVARNLRFSSAQPKITDNVSGLPIGFQITETLVDGISQGSTFNLDLGNLHPGGSIEIVWRLVASLPGRFVEFTSDYRQINLQGMALTPFISEINTTFDSSKCEVSEEPGPYFTISGKVTDIDGNPISGVAISYTEGGTVVTDINGGYTTTYLVRGNYVVTPIKSGYTFCPATQNVSVQNNAVGINFTAFSGTGPNVCISHIEVTQAIQDEYNSVPLIADKLTAVRVYLDCTGECSELKNVAGELRGFRDEKAISSEPVPSINRIATIENVDNWTDHRNDLRKTLNFTLPINWVSGQLTLVAKVFGIEFSLPINFVEQAQDPRIAVVEIVDARDGTRPNREIVHTLHSWSNNVYPVRIQPVHGLNSVLWLIGLDNEYKQRSLLLSLQLKMWWYNNNLFNNSEKLDAIYGVVSSTDVTSSVGAGSDDTKSGYGWDSEIFASQTFAHEVGHIFGRLHTIPSGCNKASDIDKNWPYPDDKIQEWGLASNGFGWLLSSSSALRDPDKYYDFMSYCWLSEHDDNGNNYVPAWISPYTYNGLHNYFSSEQSVQSIDIADVTLLSDDNQTEVELGTYQKEMIENGISSIPSFIFVSGLIYSDGNAILEPFWITKSNDFPDTPTTSEGEYCLVAEDAFAETLSSRCFDITYINYDPNEIINVGRFQFILPYSGDIARIVLMKDQSEIVYHTVSPNSPDLNILYPVGGELWNENEIRTIRWTASDLDGDILSFNVFYSPDSERWMPLAINITATELEVDTSELAGGDNAKVLIMVSDGFNTNQVQSIEPFSVEKKIPLAFIISPDGDGLLPAYAPLFLQGYAYDLEDGSIDESAFIWTSSLDGSLGSGNEILVSLSPGQHEITLTVTDSDGNTSTDSINVTSALPMTEVSILGPEDGIAFVEIDFTATINPADSLFPITYEWQATDQTVVINSGGVADTVTFVWDTPGTKTVTVTASNELGSVTSSHTIEIHSSVKADFTASPTSGEAPLEVTFANISEGDFTASHWDFGDGTTNDLHSPIHVYTMDGVFSVTLTVSGPGGTDTLKKQNYISVGEPITGLTVINDSPTELGNPTTFYASVTGGSNITYSWDFGYGFTLETGSEPQVSHTYPLVGTYTATVTATNSVSSQTAFTTVTIVDVPVEGLEASNDSPTGLGNPTSFSATIAAGTNVSFDWDFGDGNTGSGANVFHTYSAPGTYTASVTASNSVSEVTASTTVYIGDVPITGLHAVNDSPTELGNPTTFLATTDTGTNIIYTWDFGDGSTGIGAEVAHTYESIGTYNATVTATNSVGEETATTVATVVDVPVEGLEAANDGPTELGNSTGFFATITAGTNVIFSWDFGDGNTGIGMEVNHTYLAPGMYIAVVTASNSVSTMTASTTVIVEEPIAGLLAANDSPTLLGEITTLTASISAGSNVSYVWDLGDGSTLEGAEVMHVYPEAGAYIATVTASNEVSSVTATTNVLINTPPVAVDDEYTTDEDTPLIIAAPGVLDNDSDADGDMLTVISHDDTGLFGSVTVYPNGSFFYDPDGQFERLGTGEIAIEIFTYAISDGNGGTASAKVTITVTGVNDAPTISVDPVSLTVQYSDGISPITINASDVDSASLSLSAAGLPDSLILSEQYCTGSKPISCSAVITGTVSAVSGTYTINVSVDDGEQTVSMPVTLTVMPENAVVEFDPSNPVAVKVAAPGGNSGSFDLSVLVSELIPDLPEEYAMAGEIGLAEIDLRLVPVGPGSTVNPFSCSSFVTGSGYDATQMFTCSFNDVPVNTYTLAVQVIGGYYEGYGEDVLVVYDPSLGFATGGGWFFWPETGYPETGYLGDKTNFGFTMKYNKSGRNIQGSLLLIRHLPDETIFRVKSNALYGLSLGEFSEDGEVYGWASFSGKATYLEPGWPEPVGNHEFIVYIEDRNEPGSGTDRFWIEVRDKDGNVIGALSIDRLAIDHAIEINGGNIVVPHGGGGKPKPN